MFKKLRYKIKGLTTEELTLTEKDKLSLSAIFNILAENRVEVSKDIKERVCGINTVRSVMTTINQEFIYLLDRFGEIIATVIVDYNKNDIICMEV